MSTAAKNKFSRFSGVIKSTAIKDNSAVEYQTQLNKLDREIQVLNNKLHELNKDPFGVTLSEKSQNLICELTSERSKLIERRSKLVESYTTK
jgi:RNA processing factor Prp31